MTRRHPCPPGDYTWWIGPREDGPFSDTDTTNRDDAVTEAVDEEYDWIAWARRHHVDLSRHFDVDDWLDRIADQMDEEDGPDEDGDNHPLEGLNREDVRALGEAIRSAIWHWQNRRALPLRSYWLDMPYGPEEVVRDLTDKGGDDDD